MNVPVTSIKFYLLHDSPYYFNKLIRVNINLSSSKIKIF